MTTRVKGSVAPKASEIFLNSGDSVEDALGEQGTGGTSTATPDALFKFGSFGIGEWPTMFINEDDRFIFKKETTVGNDTVAVNILQDYNNVDDLGSEGWVSSPLRVVANVTSPGLLDYVWGINSIVNNYADGGEQVGVSGKVARKAGIGPAWGGHFQVVDETGGDNTGKRGLVGIETGIKADGGDGLGNRVIIDAIGKKAGFSSEDTVITVGVRSHCQKTGNVKLRDAFWADNADVDYSSNSSIGGKAFNAEGSYSVGIDLRNGTYSRSAIRMATGDQISFNETDAFNIRLDAASITLNNDGDAGTTPSKKYIFDMNRSAPTAPKMVAYKGIPNSSVALTAGVPRPVAWDSTAEFTDTGVDISYNSGTGGFTIPRNVKRVRLTYNYFQITNVAGTYVQKIDLELPTSNWRGFAIPALANQVDAGDAISGQMSAVLYNDSGADQVLRVIQTSDTNATVTNSSVPKNNAILFEVLEWA